MCEKSGVHTQFVPDYHNIIPTKPYTEDLQGLPVVNIRYVPLSNTFNAMLKRIVDIFGALVAIILFSPVMLFSCIMIKLTSPGPLIYRQTRVGLHNKPFEMYKFRSMEVQTEEKEKKAWTVKNDPRVTGFGKFMRHTSIDELPQLFNILKGDMSLVGPRPERPFFVEKFREEDPALYGKTSGSSRSYGMGAGEWIPGILLSASVLTVICIILKTGRWDLILKFCS